MIAVKVEGIGDLARGWRQRIPRALEQSLATRAWALGAALAGDVKQNKLDGQVLARRSGRLAASITAELTQGAGRTEVTIGSNAAYARFQEYGFTGTETVRQHLRRITRAFGRPIQGGGREILVRSYQRRVDYPSHSFLGSALDEAAPGLVVHFTAAVEAVLAGERT